MRLLLTGGGTAGHINPALAIAEIFLKNRSDTEIFFSGTPNGMESRLVKNAGYPYFPIKIQGLSRSLSPENIKSLYLAATSPIAADRILKEIKPELVVGTGGYVSWPLLVAASRRGIKCALHESNAIPGLTAKKLCRRVDLMLLNFKSAEEYLPPCKSLHCGCPTFLSFQSYSKTEAKKRLKLPQKCKLIVSFGGSLGAAPLNQAILSLTEKYVLKNENVYLMHGYGARYEKEFKEKLRITFGELPKRVSFLPYLDDMPCRMSAADLLISRSGAMTLTEASLTGSAAILIPSPNVAADHQTQNALVYCAGGGGHMLRESELTEDRLFRAVKDILENDQKRESMERAAASFACLDANRKIYEALMGLL